jgi:hypothetical protein
MQRSECVNKTVLNFIKLQIQNLGTGKSQNNARQHIPTYTAEIHPHAKSNNQKSKQRISDFLGVLEGSQEDAEL